MFANIWLMLAFVLGLLVMFTVRFTVVPVAGPSGCVMLMKLTFGGWLSCASVIVYVVP